MNDAAPIPVKRGRPVLYENQEEVIVKMPKQTLDNIADVSKWIAENKELVALAIPKGTLLTSRQAAKYLGISVMTLVREHKNKIGYVKMGTLVQFDIDDLIEYKRKRRVKPVTT